MASSTRSRCSGKCPGEDYNRGHGWKYGLNFRRLTRFARTYPLEKSCLSTDPRRGVFLNEIKFTEDNVDSTLEATEDDQGEG